MTDVVTIFGSIGLAVIFVMLVFVSSVKLQRSALSLYELKRRRDKGDTEAKQLLRVEEVAPIFCSLQRLIIGLSLVAFAALSVIALPLLLGLLLAVLSVFLYQRLTQLAFIRRGVQRAFEGRQMALVCFIENHQLLRRIVVGRPLSEPSPGVAASSLEELAHLIESSPEWVMSRQRKATLQAGMQFDERLVHEIMTPRDAIDSIPQSELLGPLVLDDLHKTGHSRFPVTHKDLDHVVGILSIADLLTFDTGKGTTTVKKAMQPRVFYAHQNQTLQQTLAAFLTVHHDLLIVIDDHEKTVGLVSLEDVIGALLGHKPRDRYGSHEDVRSVATRI